MGKTYSTYQGTKVSGAIRRIGNLAGRTRREWAEAKRFSNHVYAGHVAARNALPRLIRKVDRQAIELQAIAIEDAIAEAAQSGPAFDVVSVETVRPRYQRQSFDAVLQEALAELSGR